MNLKRSQQSMLLAVAVAAIALMVPSSFSSAFANNVLSCDRKENVASAAHDGALSPLERTRCECPLLGNIIEEFAMQDLGEEFPGETVNPHAREIAVVAAFAAVGDASSMKRHAQYALDAGATRVEFKELLYLTAVYAGV